MRWKNVNLGEVSLRRIAPAHEKDIYQLMQRIYPPLYKHLWTDGGIWYVETAFHPNVLAKELADENAPYWIVAYEGTDIGILRYCLDEALPEAPAQRAMKLHRLYLDQNFHNKGIGQTLLRFTEDTAKQLNKDVIWLETMDTEPRVLGFYEKSGFVRCGVCILDYERVPKEQQGMYRLMKHLQ